MLSLAKVVSALQRELQSALSHNLELPGGVSLGPDKLTVSLQFAAQETREGEVHFFWSAPSEVAVSAPAGHPHTLTIEFKAAALVGEEPPAMRITGKTQSPVPKATQADASQIKDALSRIFGTPGFDSSARATVFREAFAELSPEQAHLVMDSISGAAPEDDEQAKRSRTLLLKLVRSAPLESPQEGIDLLSRLFRQNSLEAILTLVAREWKTQEDWL